MTRAEKVADLKARGFDRSVRSRPGVTVQCSQCEALVINGHATHERGCPNVVPTCRECGGSSQSRLAMEIARDTGGSYAWLWREIERLCPPVRSA